MTEVDEHTDHLPMGDIVVDVGDGIAALDVSVRHVSAHHVVTDDQLGMEYVGVRASLQRNARRAGRIETGKPREEIVETRNGTSENGGDWRSRGIDWHVNDVFFAGFFSVVL